MPNLSAERAHYLYLNPFVPLLDLFRTPFGVSEVSVHTIFVLLVAIIFFGFLSYFLLKRYKNSVVYWV